MMDGIRHLLSQMQGEKSIHSRNLFNQPVNSSMISIRNLNSLKEQIKILGAHCAHMFFFVVGSLMGWMVRVAA